MNTTTTPKRNNIQPNKQRAQLAIYVFWGIIALSIIAVISGYFEYELLQHINNGGFITDAEANANDTRQSVVGILQSGLSITAIVVFLNWFRRAYANVSRLGLRTEHADNMAIWSFVIPIISLFQPYKIAKEIATKTQVLINRFSAQETVPPTTAIGFWWAAFIISNVLGRIAMRTVFADANSIQDMMNSSLMYLFSDAFDCVAALLTILMIQQLSKKETELYHLVHNQTTTTTPEDNSPAALVTE